jgi:hypothetical protein
MTKKFYLTIALVLVLVGFISLGTHKTINAQTQEQSPTNINAQNATTPANSTIRLDSFRRVSGEDLGYNNDLCIGQITDAEQTNGSTSSPIIEAGFGTFIFVENDGTKNNIAL